MNFRLGVRPEGPRSAAYHRRTCGGGAFPRRNNRFSAAFLAILATLLCVQAASAQPDPNPAKPIPAPKPVPVSALKKVPVRRLHKAPPPPKVVHHHPAKPGKLVVYPGVKGNWQLNGRVLFSNPGASTFTMTEGGPRYIVLVQRATTMKTRPGRNRGLGGLWPGDQVHVSGVRMDDGRILALTVELKPAGPLGWVPSLGRYAGLTLTNLKHGDPVPPNFDLRGKTAPGASVRVTVRSTRPLSANQLVSVNTMVIEGKADGSGAFDIPIRVDTEPPGSNLDLEVVAGDRFGNRAGPAQVNVIRQ